MPLFETNSVISVADLISQLNTFLTTGGGGNPAWTADRHVPASGEFAISKDQGSLAVEVAFQWDTTTPDVLGIYQYNSTLGAGNYVPGSLPWGQVNDSGNGFAGTANASLLLQRHIALTSTPIRYWAFASSDARVYIVVEVNTNAYAHFCFGTLLKYNDWTGGEYACGYRWLGGISSSVGVQVRNTALLDGIAQDGASFDAELQVATIRVEGIPASPTSGMWMVHLAHQAAGNSGNNWLLGQDRQAVPIDRIQSIGGFRSGSIMKWYGQFRGTVTQGLVSTYPIVCINSDRNDTNAMYPMGEMVDVRGVSMRNFEARQTVTIGADTWHIFPTRTKGETGALINTSGWQGIMYKEN